MSDRASTVEEFAADRERMVVLQLEARGIRDADVLRAMRAVPRDRFVPSALRTRAYADGALSIGEGQTISQPFIVALTSEALRLGEWRDAHPDQPLTVLDIGAGSGYQAAVLAEMGVTVTAVELIPRLANQARERLTALRLDVTIEVGDGSAGFRPNAPYAGIVVAAAAPDVPQPLLDQLADDGTLVIPVGDRYAQILTAVTRRGDGFEHRDLEPVVFVPLLGRYGFR
jgi:protein-L-isoaspartate(D-aspartate) O-methyltransferase